MSRAPITAGAVLALTALASCQAPSPETKQPGNGPEASVGAVAVATYRFRNITRSKSADGYASFSPDGTRLAYSSVRDGNRDLYIMDLGTGDTRRVTDHPADDGGPPAWSVDGATLYFRSKRDGEHYNIYRLDLQSGEVARLTEAAGGEGYVDVSPDGQTLLFHSERDQTDDDRNLIEEAPGRDRRPPAPLSACARSRAGA